ncbi:acetyltransferase domain-containing protein [Xylaria sp. FL0933]|nr:acetyltransferase domain-containing protein [Xylaria sp. FL0933]
MRVNEDLAISTSKILLVPYDAHHVQQYHQWMQDEDLREATASDLLTLEEEYENQQSWRTAHDKLTFIVCEPATLTSTSTVTSEVDADAAIFAGEDDAEERMVGDVNLFLTPDDNDEEEGEDHEHAGNGEKGANSESKERSDVKGEIDIMIASPEHRRKGCGEAAVRAFLRFLVRHQGAILEEYGTASSASFSKSSRIVRNVRLKRLVAKINADNTGSIRLFEKVGFRRHGEPNYFNEVSMVLEDFLPLVNGTGSEDEVDRRSYRECFYDRSRLKE